MYHHGILLASFILGMSKTLVVGNGSSAVVSSQTTLSSTILPSSLSDFIKHDNERALAVGDPCTVASHCGTECDLSALAADPVCYYPDPSSTSTVACSDGCGAGRDVIVYCTPKCNLPYYGGYGSCSQYVVVDVAGCQGELRGVSLEEFCWPIGCPEPGPTPLPPVPTSAPTRVPTSETTGRPPSGSDNGPEDPPVGSTADPPAGPASGSASQLVIGCFVGILSIASITIFL